jgi:hypothetical protein
LGTPNIFAGVDCTAIAQLIKSDIASATVRFAIVSFLAGQIHIHVARKKVSVLAIRI